MAFWNRNKIIKENTGIVDLEYKPSLSENFLHLTEQFKGQSELKTIKFPQELGEEHPFDFKQMEELYKRFGFFTAVVDKYIDYIVGPGFYIVCENEQAKKIIEDFIQDVGFDTLLRQWCKEALVKGNGFLEIGGTVDKGIDGLKVLNANYMYVVRDKLGNVEGYNQYTGAFNKLDKTKIVPFTSVEIAHIPFNIVGDGAYGIGIGVSSMRDIDHLLQNEKDCHQIQNRKANSPLHAKLGKVDGNVKIIPKPEDVVAFGQKMETMDNKTDWATDDLVDLSVVDFGKIGDKFDSILRYDIEKLIYDFQIPAVLMGMANIPEGLAKVQLEGFQRRIQSMQAEIEKVIEEKIFKRILNANGFDIHVEFEWGTPSVMEVEGRLKLISDLIKSPAAGFAIKEILEDELINIMKLDKDKWEELKAEQEELRKREEALSQPVVPGQNAHIPQKPVVKNEPVKLEKKKVKKIVKKNIVPSKKVLKKESTDIDNVDELKEFVRKAGSKWQVISHQTGKVLGTYDSEDEAKKALTRMAMFKHMKHNYEYEKECPHCQESFNDVNDIEEWLGFKYKDYIKFILANIENYDFGLIRASNETERLAGYLSDTQITELKAILEKGFKNGASIKDIADEVDKKLQLKDLYRMTEEGDIKKGVSGLPILQKSKENRSVTIVRSEITRLANMGALDYYKENGINKVEWVASYGERTCPDCESLHGRIFDIGSEEQMPLHPMCRCTYVPVVEVK
jgi:SPP1 gp7 family putative phage head morphogenesis protein